MLNYTSRPSPGTAQLRTTSQVALLIFVCSLQRTCTRGYKDRLLAWHVAHPDEGFDHLAADRDLGVRLEVPGYVRWTDNGFGQRRHPPDRHEVLPGRAAPARPGALGSAWARGIEGVADHLGAVLIGEGACLGEAGGLGDAA